MQVINLTDQPVTIVNDRGVKIKTFLSTGSAYCDVKVMQDKVEDGVPIVSRKYGAIHGLPEPDENLAKLYIVNEYVAEAVRSSRFDILVPDGKIQTQDGPVYKTLVNLI